MSKKIVFGNDLAKELKKYGLNIIGEVPTKYKNGITTIYYMWSVVSNIDKLGYKTPYIEYTIDEETDGFIMGTMFPQGNDGLGTQFDSFEDVKYFISHAEYNNADLTESLKEKEIEYHVGDETWQGFEIVKMENGKKFYLSKLAKNIENSTWSSDHTYAKHFKNKSRAEEIVDEFNSLNESLTERSQENEITVSELQDTVEYFCGLFEEKGELKGNALKDLKNAVERLEVFNSIGSIYQWGVEVLNKCGVKYNGLKESLKEGTDLKDILSIINNLDDYKLPSAMTFNYLSKWIKEYAKIYNLSIPKFDDYKNWNGKEWKIYFGTISNMPKPRKSIKEGKNVKKSLEIIRRKLMELINDDTIQEEFNEVWEDNGIYDSVDDMFEVSVHNVLNNLLKENTIAIIPF